MSSLHFRRHRRQVRAEAAARHTAEQLLQQATGWGPPPPPSRRTPPNEAATWNARLRRVHAAYAQLEAALFPMTYGPSHTTRILPLTSHSSAARRHPVLHRLWVLLQGLRRALPPAQLADHPLEHPAVRHVPPPRPADAAAAMHRVLRGAAAVARSSRAAIRRRRHQMSSRNNSSGKPLLLQDLQGPGGAGTGAAAQRGRAGGHTQYSQLLSLPPDTEYIMLWSDDDVEAGGRGLATLAADVLWLWAGARALEANAAGKDVLTRQSVPVMAARLALGIAQRAAAVRQRLEPEGSAPPPLPFRLQDAAGWRRLWSSTRREGWRWTQSLPPHDVRYKLEPAPQGRQWGVTAPPQLREASTETGKRPSRSSPRLPGTKTQRGASGQRVAGEAPAAGAAEQGAVAGLHADAATLTQRWQQQVLRHRHRQALGFDEEVSSDDDDMHSMVDATQGMTAMDAAVVAAMEGVTLSALEHAAAASVSGTSSFGGGAGAAPLVHAAPTDSEALPVLRLLEAAAGALRAAALAAIVDPDEDDPVDVPLLPAHTVLGIQLRGAALAAFRRSSTDSAASSSGAAAAAADAAAAAAVTAADVEEAVARELASPAPVLALAMRGHLAFYMMGWSGRTVDDNLFNIRLPKAVHRRLTSGLGTANDMDLGALQPLMQAEGGYGEEGSVLGLQQLRETAQAPLLLSAIADSLGLPEQQVLEFLQRQLHQEGVASLPLLAPRDVAAIPVWTTQMRRAALREIHCMPAVKRDAGQATVPVPQGSFSTRLDESHFSDFDADLFLARKPSGVLLPMAANAWAPGGVLTHKTRLVPTQHAPSLEELLAAAAAAAALDWESLRPDGSLAPMAGSVCTTLDEKKVGDSHLPLPWVDGRGAWHVLSAQSAPMPGWTAALPCPAVRGALVMRAVQGVAVKPALSVPGSWHLGIVLQPPMLLQHPPYLYPEKLTEWLTEGLGPATQQAFRGVALTASGAHALVASMLQAAAADRSAQLQLVRTVWRVLLARILLGAALLHGRATPVVLPLRRSVLGQPPRTGSAAIRAAWQAAADAQLQAWQDWWQALLPALQVRRFRDGALLRCSLGAALDALMPTVLPPALLESSAAEAAATLASPKAPFPPLARSRLDRLLRLAILSAEAPDRAALLGAIHGPLSHLTSRSLPCMRSAGPLLNAAGLQLAMATEARGHLNSSVRHRAVLLDEIETFPTDRVETVQRAGTLPALDAREWTIQPEEGDDEDGKDGDPLLLLLNQQAAATQPLPLLLPPHHAVGAAQVWHLRDWTLVDDGQEPEDGSWAVEVDRLAGRRRIEATDVAELALGSIFDRDADRTAISRLVLEVRRPLPPVSPRAAAEGNLTMAGLWGVLQAQATAGLLQGSSLVSCMVLLAPEDGTMQKFAWEHSFSGAEPLVGGAGLLHNRDGGAEGTGWHIQDAMEDRRNMAWAASVVIQARCADHVLPAAVLPPVPFSVARFRYLRWSGYPSLVQALAAGTVPTDADSWPAGSVGALLLDPWAQLPGAAPGPADTPHTIPALAAAAEANCMLDAGLNDAPSPLHIEMQVSVVYHAALPAGQERLRLSAQQQHLLLRDRDMLNLERPSDDFVPVHYLVAAVDYVEVDDLDSTAGWPEGALVYTHYTLEVKTLDGNNGLMGGCPSEWVSRPLGGPVSLAVARVHWRYFYIAPTGKAGAQRLKWTAFMAKAWEQRLKAGLRFTLKVTFRRVE